MKTKIFCTLLALIVLALTSCANDPTIRGKVKKVTPDPNRPNYSTTVEFEDGRQRRFYKIAEPIVGKDCVISYTGDDNEHPNTITDIHCE